LVTNKSESEWYAEVGAQTKNFNAQAQIVQPKFLIVKTQEQIAQVKNKIDNSPLQIAQVKIKSIKRKRNCATFFKNLIKRMRKLRKH